MKDEPIKSTKTKTVAKPETEVSLEQDIMDYRIQINKFESKILTAQRKILRINQKNSFFDKCEFKDFPDK